MENRTTPDFPYFIKDANVSKNIFRGTLPVEVNETNPIYEKLATEGCANFYNYIDWLGLAKDPNLTILSSSHHYFYDTEDLKEVRVMVNLKQLNHIKQIREFLHNVFHILPHKSYLIGCFFDNKNQNGTFFNLFKAHNKTAGQDSEIDNGIGSRIPLLSMMYDILDARTNRYLSKRTVSLMLGDAGLKVLDITELNGLTFFCAQKIKTTAE
jgi:hypothetical protein